MFHLFWGILNIALLIGLFVGFVKVTKLIASHYGRLAGVLFVLVFLSFNSRQEPERTSGQNSVALGPAAAPQTRPAMHSSFAEDIHLENSRVAHLELSVIFARPQGNERPTPIQGYTGYQGFVSGKTWKMTGLIVQPTGTAGDFEYHVNGVVEWKLLWLVVYSETKIFTGTIRPTGTGGR